MKKIWNLLGDTRLAFGLLLTASAILLIGSNAAGNQYELFHQLNRMRIQDWLPVQWAGNPELVWWMPLLFLTMGLLGINTFICATNRVIQLIGQRRKLSTGRFFVLLMPSLVHFLFIVIMIGHLMTFTLGHWQALPLTTGDRIVIEQGGASYEVRSIDDRFFPETSALADRIAQTTVTLVDVDGKQTKVAYTRPAALDGNYFFLDKAKKKKPKVKPRIMPSKSQENCNKAQDYVEPNPAKREGSQLLLVVSDPGLPLIVIGLTLILILMSGYYLLKSKQ